MNETIKKPIAKWASSSQRGFVFGRQGLDNVVDVYTRARMADMRAAADKIPAIMLYDYAAAFPSVSHVFLFVCLTAAGLPGGMIAFFRALYTNNQVYVNIDGEILWLYEVLAGVLQGCPASGSLFVIALNPCLIALHAVLGKHDICRTHTTFLRKRRSYRILCSSAAVCCRVVEGQHKPDARELCIQVDLFRLRATTPTRGAHCIIHRMQG